MREENMLTGVLEDNALAALCYSNIAPKLALRLTRDHFSNRAYKRIADAAFAYIAKYHEAPRSHIRDLLEDRLNKGDDGKLMSKTITAMEELEPELNTTFVIDSLDRFIELRQLNDAIEKASEACDRGELEKAQEALNKSRPKPRAGTGLWLADTERSLKFLDRTESDYFSTGVEALDRVGIRPERKTLLLLVAPTGMGKSWFLVECGKQGIMHGKRVLHVSLEMNEDEVCQRYVQSLLAMTDEEVDSLELPRVLRDNEGDFVDFLQKNILPDHISPEARPKLVSMLRFLERRAPFRIEAYPSGSLSLAQLDMQLDALKDEYDFRPDLILVDYPDIMQQDADQLRISLGQTFVGLRGIAQSRDAAMVAVTQGNRSSAGAKVVRGNMVAEDWSKIATADKVLTYSRTEEESLQNRARLFVEKGRTKRDKFFVWVLQSYATGQFCLDSVRHTARVAQALERIKQDAH